LEEGAVNDLERIFDAAAAATTSGIMVLVVTILCALFRPVATFTTPVQFDVIGMFDIRFVLVLVLSCFGFASASNLALAIFARSKAFSLASFSASTFLAACAAASSCSLSSYMSNTTSMGPAVTIRRKTSATVKTADNEPAEYALPRDVFLAPLCERWQPFLSLDFSPKLPVATRALRRKCP